jgi:hypothetical protein
MKDSSFDARIILKYIIKQKNVKVYNVVDGSELWPRANCCEDANITLSSEEHRKIRYKLSDYWLLKKNYG